MTWLYIPNCAQSASAPAAPGSTLDLNWQSQALALSVTWRGKHSASRDWLRRCKRASWLTRLCGLMCQPSEADRGAASWMASLAASPASLTAWPESERAQTTSATCGQTRGASSPAPGRGSSSSKTSPECLSGLKARLQARRASDETWPQCLSELKSYSSARRKSAPAMSGREHSSSPWPTPQTFDSTDLQRSPEARARALEKGGCANLREIVTLWQTPSVADTDGTRERRGGDRSSELLLKGQAREVGNWMTPAAGDATRGADMKRRDADSPNSQLTTQLATWPTPTSLSFADSHQPGNSRNHNETMRLASSLPVPATDQHGSASPPSDPTCSRPQLNPAFVEWLMGWPPGWTSYACSATAWSHYRQRMRSAFLSMRTPVSELPRSQNIFIGA